MIATVNVVSKKKKVTKIPWKGLVEKWDQVISCLSACGGHALKTANLQAHNVLRVFSCKTYKQKSFSLNLLNEWMCGEMHVHLEGPA